MDEAFLQVEASLHQLGYNYINPSLYSLSWIEVLRLTDGMDDKPRPSHLSAFEKFEQSLESS